MSGVFQVMHELGIEQFKSSAYHPESQGALVSPDVEKHEQNLIF